MMREGFGKGRDGWEECLEVEMIGWELEILMSDFRVFNRDLNMWKISNFYFYSFFSNLLFA